MNIETLQQLSRDRHKDKEVVPIVKKKVAAKKKPIKKKLIAIRQSALKINKTIVKSIKKSIKEKPQLPPPTIDLERSKKDIHYNRRIVMKYFDFYEAK